MYTLEEGADRLGIGYGALRDRLRALNGLLDPYMSRGKKGKILVDENGLHVLRRMLELERSGMSIADSAQAVRKEMALGQDASVGQIRSPSTDSAQSADELSAVWQLVEQLRDENTFLKQQISMKDDQILRLQELFQNRLPGEVTKPQVEESDTVQYLKQLAERQRDEIASLRQTLDGLKRPWWRRILSPKPVPQEGS